MIISPTSNSKIDKNYLPTRDPVKNYPNLDTSLKNCPIFPYLNKEFSYIPYSGCVLEHILCSPQFSNLEKLKYLLGDSLSLINYNNGKQRAVSLSAAKWAKMLNCSKAQVFATQKSLEEKCYLIVERTKNKHGKNKRNLLIPTLPDQVFAELRKAPTRWNAELTGYNSTVEAKRAYLDRTKLFIPLNYQLLKLIISNNDLTSFAKVLFIDFYCSWHKCHMAAKNDLHQQNKSSNHDTRFSNKSSPNSLVIFYQQLMSSFNCDKPTLSRTMLMLQKLGFIYRERFHIKNEDKDDNLHDKSLWKITLTLPPTLLEELAKGQNRTQYSTETKSITKNHLYAVTNLSSNTDYIPLKDQTEKEIANTDPYIVNSSHHYIKDIILNNDIKDLDNIDVKLLSEFYNNSIQEKELNDLLPQQIKTPDCASLNNSEVKENKGKQIEALTITQQHIGQIKEKEKTPVIRDNTTLDPNRNIKGKNAKFTKIVKFSPNAKLKDWHPLSAEDVDRLNSKSGREFSSNFANQLLLKLHSKYPNRIFPTKNHMISYMTIALQQELHQGPLVNHETFRFAKNDQEFMLEQQREKYLSEVEYSTDTSYHSQLKRKIAAMFKPILAYQLLTTSEFITTIQEQRASNNYFDDQYLETELTVIIQEKEALSDNLDNQQPDIIENSQDHSLTVKLHQDIQLSDLQQQILENSITAVYGHVDITYQQVQDNYKNTNKLQPRQQYEIYLEELDPNSAWYKVRRQLKDQFGEPIDKAWFSKLTAEENLKIKTLTLFAPSNFIRDYVKNKYGYMIEQFAGKLSYQVVELTTKKHVEFAA